ITFVREDLNKVITVSTNVSEMYVEDLLARTEVTDDIKNLHAWILKILRDSSLAEVKPMIGTLPNRDEFLEPVDGAEHAIAALVALGGTPGSWGWQAMRILYSFAT